MKTLLTGIKFDLSDLGFVYGVLCCLTLVAINPWGTPRHEVWTDPKVYALIGLALLTWAVLLVLLVRFVVQKSRHQSLLHLHWPRFWWPVAFLLGAFLLTGLATVYYSPIKAMNAFRSHVEMGDGWLYWAWLSAFVLGNALVLRRLPRLFKAQLYGFLIGGALMALATLPQYVNWRLDYTQTTGQEVSTPNHPNLLVSSIYQGQMPIGLTSNRGHAAFIVAATAILALVSLLRGWLQKRYAWPLYALLVVAVYLTSTRGAQLAFGVGLLYLLVRFWRVVGARRVVLIALIPVVLGSTMILGSSVLGVSTGKRSLPPLNTFFKRPEAFLSFRPAYWRTAVEGIRQRPLLGWGYGGFGLAFGYANDFDKKFKVYLAVGDNKNGVRIPIARLQGTDHYFFRYFGPDDQLYRGRVMSSKAHNIFLDMTLSLGLLGLVLYVLLLGLLTAISSRGSGWGLEAVTVVYLVYGLTWFDSAQFTHLAWWVFSAGLALPLKRKDFENEPVVGESVSVLRKFASDVLPPI